MELNIDDDVRTKPPTRSSPARRRKVARQSPVPKRRHSSPITVKRSKTLDSKHDEHQRRSSSDDEETRREEGRDCVYATLKTTPREKKSGGGGGVGGSNSSSKKTTEIVEERRRNYISKRRSTMHNMSKKQPSSTTTTSSQALPVSAVTATQCHCRSHKGALTKKCRCHLLRQTANPNISQSELMEKETKLVVLEFLSSLKPEQLTARGERRSRGSNPSLTSTKSRSFEDNPSLTSTRSRSFEDDEALYRTKATSPATPYSKEEYTLPTPVRTHSSSSLKSQSTLDNLQVVEDYNEPFLAGDSRKSHGSVVSPISTDSLSLNFDFDELVDIVSKEGNDTIVDEIHQMKRDREYIAKNDEVERDCMAPKIDEHMFEYDEKPENGESKLVDSTAKRDDYLSKLEDSTAKGEDYLPKPEDHARMERRGSGSKWNTVTIGELEHEEVLEMIRKHREGERDPLEMTGGLKISRSRSDVTEERISTVKTRLRAMQKPVQAWLDINSKIQKRKLLRDVKDFDQSNLKKNVRRAKKLSDFSTQRNSISSEMSWTDKKNTKGLKIPKEAVPPAIQNDDDVPIDTELFTPETVAVNKLEQISQEIMANYPDLLENPIMQLLNLSKTDDVNYDGFSKVVKPVFDVKLNEKKVTVFSRVALVLYVVRETLFLGNLNDRQMELLVEHSTTFFTKNAVEEVRDEGGWEGALEDQIFNANGMTYDEHYSSAEELTEDEIECLTHGTHCVTTRNGTSHRQLTPEEMEQYNGGDQVDHPHSNGSRSNGQESDNDQQQGGVATTLNEWTPYGVAAISVALALLYSHAKT